MKTITLNRILTKIYILIIAISIISCSKNNGDFVELTFGRSMDPKFPRSGIKITDENYVYYCEEIMNNGEDYYLNHHTGKYKFFKSETKIDFYKYSDLILNNFSNEIPKNYISISDATFEQITYKIGKQNRTQNFYDIQLNSTQEEIYSKIWELKNRLKFKQIDSVYFSQKLLQEKLPKPPPPPK